MYWCVTLFFFNSINKNRIDNKYLFHNTELSPFFFWWYDKSGGIGYTIIFWLDNILPLDHICMCVFIHIYGTSKALFVGMQICFNEFHLFKNVTETFLSLHLHAKEWSSRLLFWKEIKDNTFFTYLFFTFCTHFKSRINYYFEVFSKSPGYIFNFKTNNALSSGCIIVLRSKHGKSRNISFCLCSTFSECKRRSHTKYLFKQKSKRDILCSPYFERKHWLKLTHTHIYLTLIHTHTWTQTNAHF